MWYKIDMNFSDIMLFLSLQFSWFLISITAALAVLDEALDRAEILEVDVGFIHAVGRVRADSAVHDRGERLQRGLPTRLQDEVSHALVKHRP